MGRGGSTSWWVEEEVPLSGQGREYLFVGGAAHGQDQRRVPEPDFIVFHFIFFISFSSFYFLHSMFLFPSRVCCAARTPLLLNSTEVPPLL